MPLLTVDDAAIFYEASGAGRPALVLVHGGLCDRHDWDRLVPALAGRHRVVTPDLRGHGRSGGNAAGFSVERCAADLHALIAALGLAPVVLVGHSFATRVVAEAAWSRPEDVAGLVLLDGSRAVGGHAARDEAPAAAATSLANAIAQTIGPAIDEAERTRLTATMSGAPPALMAACVAEIARWDRDRADLVFAGLPAGLPVLAVQSTYHDQATPRRMLAEAERSTPYLDFLRAAVPTLDVGILPDTGHFSMIERTAEVAAHLLAFARDREEET